jgi:O-antigen/teichoic acid export membrane protein
VCLLSNITKQFLGGVKWTGISTIIITIVQLAQFAILARVLSPEDFGIMSMITVVIVFSQVFSDMGISSAIIQRQDINKQQLSSLYWLNLMAGVGVFIIVLLISPLIADFYKEPRLTDLLFYVAFIFLITPIGQQFQYLLQKELKFNVLAKVEVISIVIGSITTIVLAILEYGVLSLVIGQITTATLKALYLAIIGWSTWSPELRFKLKDLKGYISFGAYQMGSRTVNYIASNIDYILIGRYLGSEALGIYSLAYQLIVIPVTKINPIITKVAFPVFSLNQTDNSIISKSFISMTKVLSIVTFPILIGLMAISDVLVPVVFGAGWNDAIPVIQILAVLGMLRVLMNPNGSVLLAKGRADLGFIWDLGVAIFNGLAIWFVVEKGVNYVALVYVAVSAINFVLGRKLLHYVIELDSRKYFTSLVKPFIISCGMGIGVYAATAYLGYIGLEKSTLLLIGLILLGVLLYSLFFFFIDRAFISQIKNIVLRKKKVNQIK